MNKKTWAIRQYGQSMASLMITALILVIIYPTVTIAGTVAQASGEVVEAYPNYKIAAIMVTFPDNPDKPKISDKAGPWTKEYIKGVLFSNADSMAAFYANASEGQVSVSGDVFDNQGQWYTINRPVTEATCDWGSFFTEAFQAADADIDFTQYNTVMVFAPRMSCSTGGFSAHMTVPDTDGKIYGVADIDGTMGSFPHHELGHIIGLGHANSWECNPPGILTGTNCRSEEYGDRYSVMGVSSRMLQPAAPHKENMGWLKPEEIITVKGNIDFTIQAYESGGTKPKVLKIPQARDASGTVTSWYYLEYRQPVGFDNIPRTPTIQELGVPNGVLVHVGSSIGEYITTALLDMTPGSLPGHDIFDPALPVGSSYSDPVAGVSFGVLARSSSAAAIRVRFSGSSLCEWKPPTVAVKAVKDTGRRGTELSYDLTVKNNATLCGKQTFKLRSTGVPAGWLATIDKQKEKTVELIPGQSKQFKVRLVSSKKAAYKKYSLNIETWMVKKTAMKKTITLQPVVKWTNK